MEIATKVVRYFIAMTGKSINFNLSLCGFPPINKIWEYSIDKALSRSYNVN